MDVLHLSDTPRRSELHYFISISSSSSVLNLNSSFGATPSYPKKSWGGAHFSFDVFWLEVCLRLQKNLGSRILIGRNILLKPFPCKWAFSLYFLI